MLADHYSKVGSVRPMEGMEAHGLPFASAASKASTDLFINGGIGFQSWRGARPVAKQGQCLPENVQVLFSLVTTGGTLNHC